MYSYRGIIITITRYGCVIHNSNGYIGQVATPAEAEEYINMMLDYEFKGGFSHGKSQTVSCFRC